VLASFGELSLFVYSLTQQMDWLASIWLVICTFVGSLVLRQIYVELRGLRQLKQQDNTRIKSQHMSNSNVIGLAEEHCLKMANNLPSQFQPLVSVWRGGIETHHSDNELLRLFEHQVIAPIDKIALQHVSKNASAAGVMIAVSPFALLDMFIVLWRNFRMIDQISGIYGLHLGYLGRVSLVRNIFRTMLYAGAAEILSDAGNYALGAGLTGKLSARVGQGMGAGVLTARIGLKALNESRPIPWLTESKPGLSGISKQLLLDLNGHLGNK
jgi:putative membrane protein